MNKCIGCYHYDSKENLCIHGSPIFIDDICTDYQDSEFIEQIKADLIREVEKKVKAEVIEEYKLKLLNAKTNLVNDTNKAKVWVEFKRQAIEIAEQLEE